MQFGLLEERTITEGNIRCRLVFDAPLPPYDVLAFNQNIRKIIRSELQLFGRAPFDEYTVLFHWRPDLDFGGGIEHGKAMIMNIGKQWMLDLPTNMAGTFAHELFHAWNAEAIYPRDFAQWDYSRENYTGLMWFVEGVTNYYATLTLIRTGILSKERFYAMMSNSISSYENEPGRGFVSLREAGIAEWIRPIESLDYYAGGEVVGFLLDLEIRRATRNRSSLDTVMRALYEQSKRADYRGYEEQDLVKLVNESAARNLTGFFDLYVRGKGPIDYDRLLRDLGVVVGIKVEQDGKTYSLSPADSMTTDQRTFWQRLLDSAAQGT